jgi:hypothetical protein
MGSGRFFRAFTRGNLPHKVSQSQEVISMWSTTKLNISLNLMGGDE